MRLFAFLFLLLSGCAETSAQNVSKDELKAITAEHHVIAVLPALITLNLRSGQKRKLSAEEFKKIEMKMSFMTQSYFCQQITKKADKYHLNILFEDPKEINDNIFGHGRSFDGYKELTADSLLQFLDADVVMIEEATVDQTMSESAAATVNFILLLTTGGILPGNTRIGMVIKLVDKKTGKVFWQRECPPEVFADATFEMTLTNIVKTVVKALPYRK